MDEEVRLYSPGALPRVVAIGGGHGLSTMLRGLKRYVRDITAIVTMADDGGGSGMLRQDLGMLPPGDARDCVLALANTVFYAFTTAPISIAIGLLFAFMLNDKVYLRKVNRMFFFIPYICSMVALAAVFRFLFRVDGPINAVAGVLFGAEPVPWLNRTSLNRIPVVCVMTYAATGYNLIVYMAALQNVPRELYEAAMVDGAGPLRRFFRITVPLISPTTFYLLVVRLIAAFKAFSALNIMGVSKTAPSLVTEIYSNAFDSYKFGYASAEAWVLVAVILVITLIQMVGQKKWVHY